ncbi:hypothetical protein TNCV_4724301 [Trichonephila clavipes]|uniref:Uncharacterized protein n=1 Tax=Trichonephila clavipes TaxID=2585209 RepID=A0A8X6W6P2_TRICX|nr:hypothetical protein TNCV_4724301 [Trichonephila clavipes]
MTVYHITVQNYSLNSMENYRKGFDYLNITRHWIRSKDKFVPNGNTFAVMEKPTWLNVSLMTSYDLLRQTHFELLHFTGQKEIPLNTSALQRIHTICNKEELNVKV